MPKGYLLLLPRNQAEVSLSDTYNKMIYKYLVLERVR